MRRRLSVVALAFLSACAANPPAEVTMRSTSETGFDTAVPLAAVFGPPHVTLPARGNDDLAQDFLDLEFRMESGRALPYLTRFEGPIAIALEGEVPPSAPAELARLIGRFRSEAGLDVHIARPGEPAQITVDFQPRAAMQRVVPTAACFVVPNVSSFDEYRTARTTPETDWSLVRQRQRAAIFVPSDTSPQEVRDCFNEEIAQAMGPLNDLYRLTDSVYNDDNFNSILSGFDMLMLRVHYAPELHSGMNEAEVAARLPAILARLNPAGEGKPFHPRTIASRVWVNAVETAFGVRGGAGQRGEAAQKMLSIAMAQGWNDSRLALSWYAIGRSEVATDPAAAVRAFTEARRIYRSLPDTQIHQAHIDMQLSAIALASGQNAEAIAFADRAIPVVRDAQNAALLATLMLIKAEALANEGRVDEARALRLDAAPLARYGFGSESQMRARTGEIASLGARGRRA